MQKHILLLVLTLLFSNLCAQDISKKNRAHLKKGVTLFKKEVYQDALKEFLKIDSTERTDAKLNYNIGICYLYTKQASKALKHLQMAIASSAGFEDADFYLGRAYHLNHEFKNAISAFEAYKKQLKASEREKIAEVEKYITYCKNGANLIMDSTAVKITNLGYVINSEYPDYNPLISADESVLMFTSRKPISTGGRLDPKDLMYFEDIYMSEKEDGVWLPPVSLDKINTAKHEACVALSADGQQMMVYKANSGNGDLFISTLDGSTWTTPKNLGPNINSPAWESSGSISSNNDVIFFSSNRKGGVGGTDIYMSKREEDGTFGPAILLGPQVNTPDDEISPFIHADGQTLYFSSRGHRSMGGFDIFSVKIDLETGEILSNAKNVGYPINTAGDDFHFVWSADNSRAYFSSIRENGFGEKDIYMLERDVSLAPLVVWKGLVLDCITQQPLLSKITVTDNSTGKVVGTYTPNSSTGKYIVILPSGRNYGIAVESEDYAFFSKNIDIPNLASYKEIEEKICLDPIAKGTIITLRNIFFDFDRYSLRKESEIELERVYNFLTTNPDVRIEISGHTDAEGDAEYNLKLSKQRAKAVFNYLTKKGIDQNRLETNGYGLTKPIATNETREGRQLNRRTELTIK
ncbi:OmpA family protein [Cytophagaceae bacterium ABcell3]|nr:OmpA family protein [Cytophagaceae bacterium ABcell3]